MSGKRMSTNRRRPWLSLSLVQSMDERTAALHHEIQGLYANPNGRIGRYHDRGIEADIEVRVWFRAPCRRSVQRPTPSEARGASLLSRASAQAGNPVIGWE